MTSQPKFVQPPRLAVWLVVLFTPADKAEWIIGDLLEEFSDLASRAGLVVARRWYWQQAVKTVAHLWGAAFRRAPWSTCAAVLAGFLLIGILSRFSMHAMREFLDANQVYESRPASYLFWIKFPLETGRVLICVCVGALVGLAAKGRELPATVALGSVQVLLLLLALITVVARGQAWVHWFAVMATWNGLCAMGTVLGGAIVRIRRSAAIAPPSAN